MRFAEYSVPKTIYESNSEDGRGGPLFCSVQEGVKRTAEKYPLGKLLFVSDEASCGAFAPPSRDPRAISVVIGNDCLPLFTMPDDVTCVLAAGSSNVMRAARWFAEIRGAGCALFPAEASLDGVYEKTAFLTAGGERMLCPLADGAVFCDKELFAPSLSRAYARLLLSRLALFEARALSVFRRGDAGEEYERAFSVLRRLKDLSAEETVRLNRELRLSERAGLPVGEGVPLSRLLKEDCVPQPEWQAYFLLSALYSAFFAKGIPRRYFVPDYRARIREAGLPEESYLSVHIPAPKEYAGRAIALERMRGQLCREITALTNENGGFRRALRLLGGEIGEGICGTERLRYLPEHSPEGLTAVIRDFGLLG